MKIMFYLISALLMVFAGYSQTDCKKATEYYNKGDKDFTKNYTEAIAVSAKSLESPQNDYELNLTDSGRKIENSISLFTYETNYEAIKSTTGEKVNVKAIALIINEDSIDAEKINTRGQTTLYYRRKSFSFDLKSKAVFLHGERTESLKKFFALSLSMDRNYSNNRVAFEMMQISKLFSLFYSFCELRINGQSEGIYLVVERPEDWAMKKKDSPLLIRRGYNHNIDKIVTDKIIEKYKIKEYCNNYKLIYRDLNKYEGEVLYKNLSNWFDIDLYMKWLAFNFFVRNGDYTDEVYFYFDPGINKFSIIPWDYDDLFSLTPHEGNIEIRKSPGDKLIFSVEDLLDKKIASDPYLYQIYLIQLREVLDQLSPVVLKRVIENTYAELCPFYSDNEIISMSEYDAYKNVNFERLKNDMFSMFSQLIISRDTYLNNLRSLSH
jgi:spore coat protein H